MRRVSGLALLVLSGCGTSGPPLPPRQALKTFHIEEGYRIELAASEPDVVSPVAMDIDELGYMWVVEDRGYPLETEKKLGRVKRLQDTNGDGLPDKSTIFADGLLLPTGVMRWRKGILVTDAPHVWYMEDTDGDGKADVKQSLLEGFALTNPQHTVNGPVYGLDNWIYLAHENPATAIIYKDQFGDRGSDLRYSDGRGQVVTERGRNVRFQPDSGKMEALSGTSQFGHAFDVWGRHFTHNNANHIRQEVIAARYLRRNPNLRLTTAMQNISDHGSAAKVYPITVNPEFQMLTEVGEFTSACGLTIYQGGAMPGLENSAFVAEPVHNLVHRDVLSPAGATLVARRVAAEKEFLASTDPWFRPVNFYNGPDGALYVLDYYRRVIEHPEWMSAEASKQENLYQGIDRGRLWRVTAGAKMAAASWPGNLSSAGLVEHLGHANVWWRRTAQRLLVDRKAVEAGPALTSMARNHAFPLGRLHALWTLEGLGLLKEDTVEAALRDPEAGVRENAIRLAEQFPKLLPRLLSLAEDKNPRVRFQLLNTLGELHTAEAREVRDRLLLGDIGDRWVHAAAISASPEEASRLFARLSREKLTAEAAPFFRLASSAIGARGDRQQVRDVIQRLQQPAMAGWRAESLAGLAEGLARPNQPLTAGMGIEQALLKFSQDAEGAVRGSSLRLLELVGLPEPARPAVARQAKAVAQNAAMDAERRADAVTLLGIAGGAGEDAFLRGLLDTRQPEPVQIAAARALRAVKGKQLGSFLIRNWRNMTAPVRMQAADTLYADPERIPMVVEALRAGDIQAWTLSFRHKRQLIMNRDPAIRNAARPLLEPAAGQRKAVVERYRAALPGRPDAARGKAVFDRVCARCHQFRGAGSEVGPDLATVRNRPDVVLLEDILLPSRSIAQNYEAYVVETTDGENLDGVIGTQTATTLTLRREQGKEDVIPRSRIKNIYATNLSAMPEDLDKEVTPEQMADLLLFIKAAR
jgi:putative membrane-bound dehydrogenase-like protein